MNRDDAEIMARRLFAVDGEAVKREVPDQVQQERTHPVYYTLPEKREKQVSSLQDRRPRTALVKAPGKRVAQIRTITVWDRGLSESELATLRAELPKRSGRPVAELEHER